MSDAIRVNGNQHDFGSITLKINGEPFYGLSSIAYGQKRERSKTQGTGKHRAPRGRTRGKYSASASIAGPVATMEAIRVGLAAASDDGKSYGDVEFELSVQYDEKDDTPITITVHECVVANEDASDDSGSADASEESWELDPMWIDKNGLTLFDNSEGRF